MLIATKNLTIGYNLPLIAGINFQLKEGEICCLLGANGSGKSTFLKTLLGLQPALEGEVYLQGKAIVQYSATELAQQIAYVPQAQQSVFPFLVQEMVLMGRSPYLKWHQQPTKQDKILALQALEQLGIAHLSERFYPQLSGGEKQLVLIARAIAQRAKLLIMDEPTANLDFGNQIRLLEKIKQLQGQNISLLVTTHNPQQAEFLTTNIALMDKITGFEQGNGKQLLQLDKLANLYHISETSLSQHLGKAQQANNISDIDFFSLYQRHLMASNHYAIPASKWNAKAEKMAKKLVEQPSHYRNQLLQIINIQADETLLDIGCGPGTFALPLAQQCRQVYALDYSSKMLEFLADYQQKWQISNIQPLLKSWHDNWQDVPEADIVLASRSTLVTDLEDMINKLQQKARKRVILTSVTKPYFIDDELIAVIKRPLVGVPTYIYLLNALYQRGIQAQLSFIESPPNCLTFNNFADLMKSVEFSLGKLSYQEKQRLQAFYQQRQQENRPIHKGQTKWAVIEWNKQNFP